MFERLVGGADGFLLESVEGGENWARWSFAGWDPEFTLSAHDGVTLGRGAEVALADGDPLTVLSDLLGRYHTPPVTGSGWGDPVPPLFAGCVGYLGYDAVRYVEHLPDRPPDDRRLPEMVWQFVGNLAIFDRFRQSVRLVRNVYVKKDPGPQYDAGRRRLAGAGALAGRGRPLPDGSAAILHRPPAGDLQLHPGRVRGGGQDVHRLHQGR